MSARSDGWRRVIPGNEILPDQVAKVAVYCGHMFNAGGSAEADQVERIRAEVKAQNLVVGFGPLACGADILIAETLLEHGAELNVVLPFSEEDFIRESVICGSADWLPRYEACRDAAHTLHFATPGDYVGDDNQFAYNTRLAMGLAALRAQRDGIDAVQIAVISDYAQSFSGTGLAGAHADIATWHDLGRETIIIPAGPVSRDLNFPKHGPIGDGTRREIRSILFADYKGFSRLAERELPLFMGQVMGRMSEVLDRYGDHVEFRNTWGDAIYAIIDEPQVAASIALELQKRL